MPVEVKEKPSGSKKGTRFFIKVVVPTPTPPEIVIFLNEDEMLFEELKDVIDCDENKQRNQ